MSATLIRHWNFGKGAVIAALALTGCSPPSPDPVDQARAALEASRGAEAELRTAFVKRDDRHVVVCGQTGRAPAANGRVDYWPEDFVVVDGRVMTAEPPADQKTLVEACLKDIPRFDMPPVVIHDGHLTQ